MSRLKNWNLIEKYCKEIPRTSYLTHGIHPYTAKFIPHIPRFFIEKYTKEDEIVLDSFCGSGTALLEARLLGRNAIGIDINPLAVLISDVKTRANNIDMLSLAIDSVKKEVNNGTQKASVDFPNIDYWFCKESQNELSKLKYSIDNIKDEFDETTHKFLLVCLSSIIRKSSYADPRMAKTYKSKRVIEKIKKGWVPTPIQYFENALDKNFERIISLSEHLNGNNNYMKVLQGDAKENLASLKQNGIGEVDFVITSPPYINAQDYFRSYKLELWWLDLATPEEVRQLNKKTIGTENILASNYNSKPKCENRLLNTILNKIWKVDKKKSYIVYNYFEDMNNIFKESHDILKIGGHFCLITGNNTICEVQIPTYKILTQIAENNGFTLVEMGKDKIRNRLLPPDRNHNGGIIKEEWISVFKNSGG